MLSKIQFLVDTSVWPGRDRIDPIGWLSNFTRAERPFALNMLNVFMYFNDSLTDALFRRSFHNLSTSVVHQPISHEDANEQWRKFLSSVCITYVEGEHPNPTDSGLLFARKARQVLTIDERQIFRPEDAVARCSGNPSIPLLLVDDFVGSGRQISETWRRPYQTTNGLVSYQELRQGGCRITYVPLVSTTYGIGSAQKNCSGLSVSSAHVIDDQYSLTNPNSFLWPDSLKDGALEFIERASARAGIPNDHGFEWKGFHCLGLALAFAHSVPDATLPLYYWERSGWKPLLRRT